MAPASEETPLGSSGPRPSASNRKRARPPRGRLGGADAGAASWRLAVGPGSFYLAQEGGPRWLRSGSTRWAGGPASAARTETQTRSMWPGKKPTETPKKTNNTNIAVDIPHRRARSPSAPWARPGTAGELAAGDGRGTTGHSHRRWRRLPIDVRRSVNRGRQSTEALAKVGVPPPRTSLPRMSHRDASSPRPSPPLPMEERVVADRERRESGDSEFASTINVGRDLRARRGHRWESHWRRAGTARPTSLGRCPGAAGDGPSPQSPSQPTCVVR